MVNPTVYKWIKAALSKPINNLSPLVVEIGRKPLRSMQGDFISQIVIITKMLAMDEKNTAVGKVQAIQFILVPLYTRPKAKPLATWLRTK